MIQSNGNSSSPIHHWGTILAAAVLREAGHQVNLFDAGLAEGPHQIKPYLEPAPDYLVIYDDGFNYLTKMCLTNMREAAFEMIALAQGAGARVIVCSSDSTDRYQLYLQRGASFVVMGEGEETLTELLAELERKDQSLHEIQGLAFLEQGKVILTPKRPVLKDLDSLPLPAWDLIEIDPYRRTWLGKHGYFSLNIATTRGCPFKCNWCAKPIYGNRYNSRSPQRVVDEIELLISRFQPDHFWMCDDIFGLKPGWVQEFRDEVNQRKVSFKYKIQSRVDLLLQEDTVAALADSGLETAWVGAESGSQKILDAMDKGTTVEQIYEATARLKEAGIRVGFFLQFGYLGEVKADIEKTIDMVLELMPEEIGISVSYPLPGTKFHEMVKSQLTSKSNWSDSDDLDMMFTGRFQPTYYKRLHRYVHKVYRQKMGSQTLQRVLGKGQLERRDIRRILASIYYLPASKIDRLRLKKLEQPVA